MIALDLHRTPFRAVSIAKTKQMVFQGYVAQRKYKGPLAPDLFLAIAPHGSAWVEDWQIASMFAEPSALRKRLEEIGVSFNEVQIVCKTDQDLQ